MAWNQRLQELGLELPRAPRPVAAYQPAVMSGKLVFTAGQLPLLEGKLIASGKLGAAVSTETGYRAAKICALNCLAVVAELVGSLDRVRRIVKVTGFVSSTPEFTGQPQVLNGASELLGEIFGSQGGHSRSAVGVSSLPLDAPVEVEMVVEVD